MTSHLELNNEVTPGKKVGPAVPPKPKKTQPLVPKSYSLNNQCEPSFSTLLQGSNLEKSQQQLYTNLPPPCQAILSNATYCNITPQPQPQNAKLSNIEPSQSIYSNITPSNNSDNLYCNVGNYNSTQKSVLEDVYSYLDLEMEGIAKFNFKATADDELSFEKGQNVQILDLDSDLNWYRAEIDGKIGYIPKNYIKTKIPDWFYGRITRVVTEKILFNKYIGAFLIRISESSPEDFSLSVKCPDRIHHFKVFRDDKRKFYLWNLKFDNLNKLVDYYRTASVSRSHEVKLLDMIPEEITYINVLNRRPLTNNVNPADELPPPPPPPPTNELGEYATCIAANFPPPPDELPPPPSPVSSSYSELRRATYQPDYGPYAPSSQSSTYESIYEPINPRPASQMSSRSNYSLYAPYVSGSQNKSSSGTNSRSGGQTAQGQVPSASGGPSSGKEAEVDALTDLLVQSLDTGGDSDIFGICAACGERVVGEGSGCTAMDQTYHISCFTCQHCAIQLQGKPFYALDGKPYCEDDYLNTLEKCSVCMKPILERILRATGKPYHPQCFSCIVCGKSLDGIPFTVDATNQIHCIEDFHKKFAPRCCVCKLPIMPEPGQDETVRVVALDRSFHIGCYKCEDCGLVLSSEAEGRGCYPLDDHVLCKSCNANRVQALTSHMITEL